MKKQNIFAIAAILLAIATLLLTNWNVQLSKQNETILVENQQLSGQVEELDNLKESLQKEVDNLVVSYEKVTDEKQVLEELLQQKETNLAKTTANFQQFKAASTETTNSLKENIQRLFQTKISLETTIQETTEANDVLLSESGIDRATFEAIMNGTGNKEAAFEELVTAYKVAQDKATEAEMVARINKIKANLKPKEIYLTAFSATAFRVELENRVGKPTTKGKRVKRVKVSFDINKLPAKYLGKQDLYMVIKDDQNGLLSNEVKPTEIQVGTNGERIKISQSRKVELDESQRLRFNYEVMEKLKEGYYSIYVYAKAGLLGKTSFRVI